MDARRVSEVAPMKNRTTVERTSERELVVTRTFNGPARLVFEAWTKPELFRQWWVPKSLGMSCPCFPARWMFVSGAGTVWSSHRDSQAAFFGTYNEVTPHSRLVWTNEESDEGSVTTVTFEEQGGKTLLVMHELYPSKEALDAAGPGRRMRWARRSSNWTSFSSPWARAWDGHDLAEDRQPMPPTPRPPRRCWSP